MSFGTYLFEPEDNRFPFIVVSVSVIEVYTIQSCLLWFF